MPDMPNIDAATASAIDFNPHTNFAYCNMLKNAYLQGAATPARFAFELCKHYQKMDKLSPEFILDALTMNPEVAPDYPYVVRTVGMYALTDDKPIHNRTIISNLCFEAVNELTAMKVPTVGQNAASLMVLSCLTGISEKNDDSIANAETFQRINRSSNFPFYASLAEVVGSELDKYRSKKTREPTPAQNTPSFF